MVRRTPGAASSGQPDGRRLRRADLDALFRLHFDELVERCEFKHRLPTSDCEDIAQEAFKLALNKKLRREGNAAAWLMRAVDNLAIRHKTKTYRRAGLLQKWGSRPAVHGDDGQSEEID